MTKTAKLHSGDFIAVPLPNAKYGAIRVLTIYPDKKTSRTLPFAQVLDVFSGSFITRLYEYYESSIPTIETLRRTSFFSKPYSTSVWAVLVRDKWPVIGNVPLAEDGLEEPTLIWCSKYFIKGSTVSIPPTDEMRSAMNTHAYISSTSPDGIIFEILSHFGASLPQEGPSEPCTTPNCCPKTEV